MSITEFIFSKDYSKRLFKYKRSDCYDNISLSLYDEYINVCIEEIYQIIADIGLEDYSFWFYVDVNEQDERHKKVSKLSQYLVDNNIKYTDILTPEDRFVNPEIPILIKQLREEEHVINFTLDEEFIIYYRDKQILNCIGYEEGSYTCDIEEIDNEIMQHFINTPRDNYVITIYDSDIPLLIKWLRSKYPVGKCKSAQLKV